MKISIGTLSKAFDLSDEALRYYEKRGLLHPQRVGGTGYRVFERADIQRIANVQRLAKQGFTLDEIHTVYSGVEEGDLQSLYQQKLERERRELLYRERVLAHMEKVQAMLRDAPMQLLQPRQMELEPFYVLEYASIEEMWKQLPKEPLLKRLFHQLPLTAYTTLVPREALSGAVVVPSTKGVILAQSDAEALDVEFDAFRRIDATQALGCLFKLENGQMDLPALMGRMGDWMREHGLHAADDAFTQQLLSYVDVRGTAIHYSRMIVPLTSEDGE